MAFPPQALLRFWVWRDWVPADRRAEIVRQVYAVLADDPTPRERVAVARITTVMTAEGDRAVEGVADAPKR